MNTRSSYFRSRDHGKWRTDVRQFSKVKYRNAYPGIDVIYYGNQSQLEYDMVVRPGSDPSQVKLQFGGIRGLNLDGDGNLVMNTDAGELKQLRPPAGLRNISHSERLCRDRI